MNTDIWSMYCLNKETIHIFSLLLSDCVMKLNFHQCISALMHLSILIWIYCGAHYFKDFTVYHFSPVGVVFDILRLCWKKHVLAWIYFFLDLLGFVDAQIMEILTGPFSSDEPRSESWIGLDPSMLPLIYHLCLFTLNNPSIRRHDVWF